MIENSRSGSRRNLTTIIKRLIAEEFKRRGLQKNP